jgi:predicted RNA-binding Zn ribbon-like protein
MKKGSSPPAPSARNLETLEWVGGHLALDFANSVGAVNSGHPENYLHGYDDLLDWCQKADLIGPISRRNLSVGSAQAKATAFRESEALNASLRALFRAAARHEPLPQASLDHLNTLVHKTATWRRIAACDDDGRKVSCGWDFEGAPPVAVLGPIVWRAVELLESGQMDRIKECPADDCGWVFLDTSKNRSRQWCSMQSCGNLSKVRRFRDRQKSV